MDELRRIIEDSEVLPFFYTLLRDAPKKKQRDFLGIFPKGGRGGLRNSQNYFIFTVSFFVCRKFEVLGGSRIPKSKNRDFFGGSPIPKTFEK